MNIVINLLRDVLRLLHFVSSFFFSLNHDQSIWAPNRARRIRQNWRRVPHPVKNASRAFFFNQDKCEAIFFSPPIKIPLLSFFAL